MSCGFLFKHQKDLSDCNWGHWFECLPPSLYKTSASPTLTRNQPRATLNCHQIKANKQPWSQVGMRPPSRPDQPTNQPTNQPLKKGVSLIVVKLGVFFCLPQKPSQKEYHPKNGTPKRIKRGSPGLRGRSWEGWPAFGLSSPYSAPPQKNEGSLVQCTKQEANSSGAVLGLSLGFFVG